MMEQFFVLEQFFIGEIIFLLLKNIWKSIPFFKIFTTK